ncbi:PREDICTED: uncharacterized protein LOC108553419 [Eufriesea mexicana]|uniref:uncharacterized protein LOC108553419 n=1 Tax=Eufriesea mexicana TaxID=516756 RepID=UPI00083BC22C|nr:PREDICTED: uncharacterized protein LOC108553419 [Eufriesea mexicana]
MSGFEKPIRPIRQLSLQPTAPHRQQIRRQRSAEDDKSLQICASPFARGKRGTSGKPSSERPKVRVAWKENRPRNEEELGQVEVVARQIRGRSRSSTGRSRGFVGMDKPTILYSRLELAERLRLAWKHREKNKANINIFLARETLDERCESQTSTNTTITAPSSPVRKKDESETEVPLVNSCKITQDEGKEKEIAEVITKKSVEPLPRNNDTAVLRKNNDKLALDFLHPSTKMKQTLTLEENKVSADTKNKEREKIEARKEQPNEQISKCSSIDEYSSSTKKKSSIGTDCTNYRVMSTTFPSIKIENSTVGVTKATKEDFSSAKEKRANFHSGTNRAFLDPNRSPTEFRWNLVSDKNAPQKLSTDNRVTIIDKNSLNRTITETKENISNEKNVYGENVPEFQYNSTNEKIVVHKIATDGKLASVIDKNAKNKTVIEKGDALSDNKTLTQKTTEANQSNSTIKRIIATSTIVENKDNSTIDKTGSSQNSLEARSSSVNERNSTLKKTENQKIDQRSRRTSSAPPQRRLESSSANNRVHVNIVLDSSGKNRTQEKQNMDYKSNAIEKGDTAVTKISTNRSVRSAPLKRRSKSAKRRFWGGGSCKNDEDGKSRNKSGGRARNSIDARTIDIVTMVSLVSSADSDSDTESSLRDDKLINELRSKLPTTSIIKTSINSALSSARKPIKTVSFQNDSIDEDSPREQQPSPKEEKKTTQPWLAIVNQRGNGGISSNDETVSWRTDAAGLALPVLALIHDVEEPLDVPLTDREKRCLAVPIGDLHDKKRKLLKTRSTPSRSGMEKQMISSKAKMTSRMAVQRTEIPAQQTKMPINNSPTNVKSVFVSPSKETLQQMQSTPAEPQFHTNKEKECWHLYKKMCDKGVCVSFDTVLRGMLTPTEYRLRKKEASQNL